MEAAPEWGRSREMATFGATWQRCSQRGLWMSRIQDQVPKLLCPPHPWLHPMPHPLMSLLGHLFVPAPEVILLGTPRQSPYSGRPY